MKTHPHHRRFGSDAVDPVEEFDFQVLKIALLIIAAVLVVLMVLDATDGDRPAMPAPGAGDLVRHLAAGEAATDPRADAG